MAGAPRSWMQDPETGGALVQYDDGASLLFDPNQPEVAGLLAALPQQDDRLALNGARNQPVNATDAPPMMLGAPTRLGQLNTPPSVIGRAPVMSAPTALPAYPTSEFRPVPQPALPPGATARPANDPSRPDMSNVVFNGPPGGQPGAAPQGAPPMPRPGYIPGTPGTLVKGGRTPASWTTQQESGIEVPEEAKQQLAIADESLVQAGDKERYAASEEARLLDEWKGQEQTQKFLAQDRRNKAEAARQQEEALALERYDQAKIVDPNRLWNSKSDMEKFGARLSIGIHDFVNTWLRTGEKNAALEALNEDIARDVQSQLQRLGSAKQDIQDMYARWGSQDAKQAAGEAMRYEAAIGTLDDWLSGVKDERIQANGLKMRAQLAQERADRLTKMATLEAGRTTTSAHEVQTPDRVVGGSAGRMVWDDAISQGLRNGDFTEEELQKGVSAAKGAGSTDPTGTFLRGRYGTGGRPGGDGKPQQGQGSPQTFVAGAHGGQGGFAADAETARKKNAEFQSVNYLLESVRRMKELHDKPLSSFGDTNAQFQSVVNDALPVFSVLNGQGALSDGDRKTLGAALGSDANDTFTFTGKAKLDAAEAMLKRRMEQINIGVDRGQKQVTKDGVRGTVTSVSGPVPTGRAPVRKAGQ